MTQPEAEILLLQLGEEMGRTPEQMRPLITRIVEENWLETRESLRALSADQWSQLRLPLRLETALKARLGIVDLAAAAAEGSSNSSSGEAVASRAEISAAGAATPKTESLASSHQQQQQQQQQQKPEEEFQVDNGDAPEGLFVCTVEDALDRFQREVGGNSIKEALGVLLQLVSGVLQQPAAAKKRKVRLANPTFNSKVGRHAAALGVLLSVGFAEEQMEDEAFFVLRTAYLRRLVVCYRLMAEVAAGFGIAVAPLPRGYFDPFSSSITSSSGHNALPKSAAGARAAEAREIERQIKERERLLATGGGSGRPPLNPQVFTLEEMRQQDRLRQQQQPQQPEQQQESWGSTPRDAAASLTPADVLRIREIMGEGPGFQSRAKQQLQQLQKRAVFTDCLVRLLLPDGLVLQLCFSPGDTLSYVKDTAAQFLHEELRGNASKWYICETPPLRRFPPRRTLYEEGLAPRCLLHLKLEDDCPPAPLRCLDEEALREAGVSTPSSSGSSSGSSSSSVGSGVSSSSSSVVDPTSRPGSALPEQDASTAHSHSSSSSSSSSKSRRTLSRLLGSKGPKK